MIYGVHLQVQKKEIDEYCFNRCGRIIIGGINLGEMGDCLPCRQSDCPHEEKSMLMDGCDVDGEAFTLRKLKPYDADTGDECPNGGAQ